MYMYTVFCNIHSMLKRRGWDLQRWNAFYDSYEPYNVVLEGGLSLPLQSNHSRTRTSWRRYWEKEWQLCVKRSSLLFSEKVLQVTNVRTVHKPIRTCKSGTYVYLCMYKYMCLVLFPFIHLSITCMLFFTDQLQSFRLNEELASRAPIKTILSHQLCGCEQRKSSSRNAQQRKRTNRTSPSAVVGVCAVILLWCVWISIVAMPENVIRSTAYYTTERILKLSKLPNHWFFVFCKLQVQVTGIHTPFVQVYRWLQRLMLCLSHGHTNGYLDILGEHWQGGMSMEGERYFNHEEW